ncbi:HNH endonuclease signature motif containing protein [Sphingomonas sp. PB2P19]|uniref:HNH endonuclease n=1 Tax=Sphingomonas rhamnosi TaxID=3096156 RepID=UPI002FC9974D
MTAPVITERLRGRAGQQQRKRRLARTSGLCERCQSRGRVTIATVVDHIEPLALGGSDEDENTRNLCDPCHLEVTAEQFGHEKRVGFAADGLPTDPDHPWRRAAG